ncbi:MAG TPA: hypothetical protein DIC52_10880 [Candidatus Latescibacteria bacterium]|nr:hypothetical protein [Candidatus Latescibacterota bacterium]
MFIFLSKLLAPLVYPLGWAVTLWVVGGVLHYRGRRRTGRRCIHGGIVVVILFSNAFVGDWLLGSLENDYAPAPVDSYPVVDAIVVLGGTTSPPLPPRLQVDVGGAFDRLLHGMRLLRSGRAPNLVLSGGVISYLTGSEVSEAERLAALAGEYGILPEQLLLEVDSRNTYENGLFTARLLRARGWHRVLLVTSASHMRRSVGIFEHQGLDVIAAPTDFSVVDKPLSPMRFMPDVKALLSSHRATKEYVGIFVYWLRDYL